MLKVSVVIITCERPDYLRTSLESVFNQRSQPSQIIVVDDCSQADYQPVLGAFPTGVFEYVRLASRSGANIARNCGVAQATGDIVAFLDDDDIWLDSFLASHVEEYQGAPDTEAIICGHKIMGDENTININPESVVSADSLRIGNRFSGMSGFSAKRCVMNTNKFDPELKNGQDWDLFVRLVQNQVKFINIQQALFLYRQGTPGGITAKMKKMQVADVDARLLSAIKHKEWLGDSYFKRRMAEQILAFLPHKSHKVNWIKKSVRMAGLAATLRSMLAMTWRKLGR